MRTRSSMYENVEGPLDPAEALKLWLVPRLQNAHAEMHNERKARASGPGLDDAFVGAEDKTTAVVKLKALLVIARRTYPDRRFEGRVALNKLPSGLDCWLPEIEMVRGDEAR